jgi:hypothetical protein
MSSQTKGHSAPTIFQEDWWLEAASRGRIQKVEVRWDGRPVGSLSFLPARRYGIRHLIMPPYTRTLGPVFDLPASNAFRHGQNIRRVTEALVKQMPPHDYFHQTLDPRDESPMAFSLIGFRVVQCFTFVMPAARPCEDVWRGCDQKTRNTIKTASQRYHVVESSDFGQFVALSLAEHAKPDNIHDFELLEGIFQACVQRGCATILLAQDDMGAVAGAVVLVRGRDTLYFWLSARSRSAPGGANALLLWKSIELAHRLGLSFDCDGYSSVAAAKFLASFGEPPRPRVEIIASSWRRETAEYVKHSLVRFRNGLARVHGATGAHAGGVRRDAGLAPRCSAR